MNTKKIKKNGSFKTSLYTKIIRELNAIFILLICLIISGAFFYQFKFHEAPCPLCLLQRLGMIAVMMGGLLNLKFGISDKHYALSMLGALVGGAVSVRQILLHIAPGSIPFDTTIFGLALYTWAFITFVVSLVGCGVLLYFYNQEQTIKPLSLTLLDKITFIYVGLIILGNLIYTLSHCHLGYCVG